MTNTQNKVIGYVFNEDGMYDKKYYFENTPSNIANFNVHNSCNICVVTDTADTLILNSTVEGFVNRFPNQKYLQEELLY